MWWPSPFSTTAVQASVAALRPILANLGYSEETRLLEAFERRFDEYRALDLVPANRPADT